LPAFNKIDTNPNALGPLLQGSPIALHNTCYRTLHEGCVPARSRAFGPMDSRGRLSPHSAQTSHTGRRFWHGRGFRLRGWLWRSVPFGLGRL
jgi:hypothetical protein